MNERSLSVPFDCLQICPSTDTVGWLFSVQQRLLVAAIQLDRSKAGVYIVLFGSASEVGLSVFLCSDSGLIG